MNFFIKVILLYALCHIAVSFQHGLILDWKEDLPSNTEQSNRVKKPLHDVLIGENNHTLALLRWNGTAENHRTIYTLLLQTHCFDGELHTQICDVDPSNNDENDWNFATKVTFLRNDRVLVSWQEKPKREEPRIKSRVIMMDTCQSSDLILFQSDNQIIVPFKNHFDIMIYNYNKYSIRHYYKIRFDHDGNPIDDTPTQVIKPYLNNYEFMKISLAYSINYNSTEGLVLTGKRYKNVHRSSVPELYSPITGWSELEEIAHVQNRYSNSSGFATICWFVQQGKEIDCKWLDDTHVNGHVLNLKLDKTLDTLPTIYNTQDGHILLVRSGQHDGKKLFVDKAHISGKCGRIMELDIPAKPWEVKFSITNRNQYCFSFIYKREKYKSREQHIFYHRFTTKCVEMPETITEDPMEQCGKNYDI